MVKKGRNTLPFRRIRQIICPKREKPQCRNSNNRAMEFLADISCSLQFFSTLERPLSKLHCRPYKYKDKNYDLNHKNNKAKPITQRKQFCL